MKTSVTLPEMGEGMIEGTIGRWLKNVGDSVQEYDPLVEVETDKVTTEVVAEQSGVLSKIIVPEGETVAVGVILAEIESGGAGVESEKLKVESPTVISDQLPVSSKPSVINGRKAGFGRISPVVARMVQEHAIDLALITGTGKGGRITKRDIVAYLESKPEQVESEKLKVESSPQPPAPRSQQTVQPTNQQTNIQPLSSMRRSIAEHMVRSVQTSPHVTTVFEVDFGNVMAHRKANKVAFAEKGLHLTYTAYLMVALAKALRQHPLVNSSWADDGIALHRDIHIGMATSVEGGDGLIVPVIRHADELNLLGMARAVNDLSGRARTNRLKPNEVQGGTFTLTNHGVSGSIFATPIINQPQAGIMGAGAIVKRVVVVEDAAGNDAMAIRPIAYLSFSFDHRILDGVSADGFATTVKQTLEGWH